MEVYKYHSLGAFLSEASTIPLSNQTRASDPRNTWAGGRGMEEACEYVRHGASFYETKAARELFNKIDVSFRDRPVRQWVPEIAGAYAVVPEYLMGMPEHMRTVTHVDSDTAPIKLFIEPSVSMGVSLEAMARRGAAIAALVARMVEVRPVELYVGLASCNSRKDIGTCIRVDTTPVSLSQIVALFNPSFSRKILFSFASFKEGATYVGNSWALGEPGSLTRANRIRKEFGFGERDVIIEGGYLPDQAKFESDPVAWVHAQIEKQREIEA
jgi:hypothetical protein